MNGVLQVIKINNLHGIYQKQIGLPISYRMLLTSKNQSLLNLNSYQDPSLSSHIETIQTQTKNLPRLKYSLTCIASTLAYNNSNRQFNINCISKPSNFRQIVNLLINYQDLKILEESLSILNVLLNQGNDLTIQEQNQIMHSLSYVKVNNEAQKGHISDKLLQEILLLTYKLKTKNQLSQFIASLLSQKMTAVQAKKFIKDLKKQQLKNISIADLIKIGIKFKTNVLLMNDILNLIYQKVFAGRDQHQIKHLFEFLPKIVEQNIDEESISYKCLQILKIVQKSNSNTKIDPFITKYLQSLLKYRKDIFLPLKRELVSTPEDFIKIVEFGNEFEIYHLLVVEYLVRNGYRGGKQAWKMALQKNTGKKNIKLKQICYRLDEKQSEKLKWTKCQITQSQQLEYMNLLPIETLRYPSTTLQKLLSQPSISNSLYVIKNLCFYKNPEQLLLTIHRISLKQKEFHLVEQIQKLVKELFTQEFVYNQIKNITKVKHKIVLKGQLYLIWLPILVKNEKLVKNLQNELVQIMGYDSIDIEDKFYVMEYLLQNKIEKPVAKFLLYLNRQLQTLSSLEQESQGQAEALFGQIKHYLKKWLPKLKDNNEVFMFYSNNLIYHLERTTELLFSKLIEFKSESMIGVLFELQKWDFYGQSWKQPYRWILTALQEVSDQNPLYTLDCLELFEMSIENINEISIPVVAKDRFMKLVNKNWANFESEHLFAIERIIQILWENHQYPILKKLEPIKPISQLIEQQRQFNKKNEYFFQSEHPTSNYLINLQMSHFFGVISQEEFVRCTLQLYDKRYSEVKRFTEKNVISLMNFIIWVYEYSEEDMDKGLSQMILAFLGYRAEGVNEISSYNIRKKCVQIVAVVSHSINLLKLPIKELLETYIGEPKVMKNLNEIIQTIIESKSSFICQLGLETIVESVIISLITCQDSDLIEEYIDFIEAICYIEESSYAAMFENSTEILYNVLKVELKIVEKYRKNLVLFVLDILKHYEFQVQNELLWFLMSKYFVEEDIQLTLLEFILGNKNGQKFKLEFSNEKFLVRLLMHHNENQQVINMVQQILNSAQKQTKVMFLQEEPQVQFKQIIKKQPIISLSPQEQFVQNFRSQNYQRCQQLLPEIRNPFLQISKQQMEYFLIHKDLQLLQNLLNFFVKNPTTRCEIMSIDKFYLRTQCLPYIFKLAQSMVWGLQSLQRIKLKSFNKHNLTFQIQPNNFQHLVKNTIVDLFGKPEIKKNILYLLKQLKNPKQQLQLLAFYSKCIPQSKNKILFLVVNDLQLEQNTELMRLNLTYKISNPSEASSELLIYHLFVHLENNLYLNSPQLINEERYIKDIMPLICTHEITKILPIANEFFINLSVKISQKINSKSIFREVSNLCDKFMLIFEAAQGTSASKSLEVKQHQCAALISVILFLYKNGDSIFVGLASKMLDFLENKVRQHEVLKQAFDFLVSQKGKIESEREDSKNQNKSQISTLTQSLKTGKQAKSSSKSQSSGQSVIFAKQSPKDDEPQIQKQNEVNDAFKKGKQLEEYMSVVPRQPKILPTQNTSNKKPKQQSSLNQSIELSIQLIDQESLIRPKEQIFDQRNFYEVSVAQSPKKSISQKERRQVLQNIRTKQNEEISIATLKEHAKFISSLLEHKQVSKQELQQLMKSIDNITSTVNEHHYYVKKLVELEVTFKLINLFKRKEKLISQDLGHFSEIFQAKLIKLHHAMSFKKQRKTIVFDDQLTIQFLKLIVKKSLNICQSRNENSVIIEIVNYCIKSIDSFFIQGLISMFIELIKFDLNVEDVLKFFCKIDINKHIIFEIYQRGLLNKFAEVFNSSKKLSPILLNLWIKLAGKICTTPAIQQKYIEKNIHKLVQAKHNECLVDDIESKKNVAFFFAYLGKKNQKVFDYLVENQILEKILSSLQNENCQQLYLLFYNILVENQNALEYSFRIKYHLHLIEKVTKNQQKPRSKYFYKSLGQIMTSKQHQSLFFKEQLILKLVKLYEVKSEPSIYECLLDFIVTLDNDKEFEELKKQQFWNCLSLFEYKLSSQATYAYILQIFLVMIKKGRIKEFNTAQVRGKVTLKAEYSINLEGKQLALRFITALSLRTKQCYITERCIRLLSSLVGFKVTSNQLDIIEDILDVDGMLENFEFFSFCYDYEIIQLICNRFKSFTEAELLSALRTLNIVGVESKNNKVLRDKLLMPVMEMVRAERQRPLNNLTEQWLFKTILIIVSFRQNNEVVQRLQLGNFMVQILQKILKKDPKERKKTLDEYVTIVQMCRKNTMIPLIELQKILQKLNKAKVDKEVIKISQIKQNLQGELAIQSNQMFNKMFQGINVKMYKNDGSSSQLILFLTEDKLELNSTAQKNGPVKQKWRIVLSEINQILPYETDKQYQNSAFDRSGGLFSRAPDRRLCLSVRSKSNEFNILFNKKEDKDMWKKYIEFAIESSKKLLKQFK